MVRKLAVLALLVAPWGAAFAQTEWVWRNPLPQGNDLAAVASDGVGLSVAVGAFGTVLVSTNGGTNWTVQMGAPSQQLYGLTYSPDYALFVAVGKSGTILTSFDGFSWNPEISGTSADLLAVTYGNGLFVAVGSDGAVLTSLDATTWVPCLSGTTKPLRAVTFDGMEDFIAVGDEGAFVSSSGAGSTWTAQALGATNFLYGVAVSPDRIVVVGWNSQGSPGDAGLILTLENQIAWLPRPSGTGNPLRSLVYQASPPLFVAVGDNGTILKSGTGTSWTAQTSGWAGDLKCVTARGRFVAVGAQGGLLTSANGSAWQSRLEGPANSFRTVIYSGTNFVAAGTTGKLLASPDGSAWLSCPSGTTNDLLSLAFGSGRFVTVGANGTLLSSTNGSVWQARTNPLSVSINAVGMGANLFVAVAANGAILTSTNGETWSAQISPISTALNAVTWGNGLYVTVGVGSKILSSSDGTNWTPAAGVPSSALYGVAYGAGKYVAVGLSGRILTSSNGTTWTLQTSGTTRELRSVIHDGKRFVAVGLFGTVVTSEDGLVWSNRTVNSTAPLRGVAFGNNTYIAVGDTGTIIASQRAELDPPIITSATNAVGEVGVPFTYQTTALNGPTSFSASGLPAGLSINTTNGLISGTPTIAGPSTVTLSALNPGGTGTTNLFVMIQQAPQTIAFAPIGTHTFGDLPITLMANATPSVLPITFEVVAGPGSVLSNQLTITGAGVIVVQAVQAGDANYLAATNAQSFVVNKAAQTISFAPIGTHTFGEGPIALNATANPSGLPVAFGVLSGLASVTGNQLSLAGAGTITVQAVQGGDANYLAATNTQSFLVNKAAQTISFAPIGTHTFGEGPITLDATASPSGLPVTFGVLSGPGSLVGNQLSLAGAGTITVQATQAGDANYLAATDTQSFLVNKAAQAIVFAPLPNHLRSDPPFLLSAAASPSGLPVSFSILAGPATISGNTLTLAGIGKVTVLASQAGNANYYAAPSVTNTFNVTIGEQLITFPFLPDRIYTDPPFALNASSSSGLPVIYTLVSGPATLRDNQVALTGTGRITIRASQPGTAQYLPAPEVERTFTVNRRAQIIAFGLLSDHQMGDGPLVLEATANSGLPVTLSLLSSGSASLAGNLLNLTNVGQVTLRASQAGDKNWLPATNVDQTFQISKRSQSINFPAVGDRQMGDAVFALAASASSGLPVAYEVLSGPAIVTGNLLTLNANGDVVIRALQPGNAIYSAATPVTNAFSVFKKTQTITFDAIPDQLMGNPPLRLGATATSGLPITYSVSGPAELKGDILTVTSNATVTVTATQGGNAIFSAASKVRSFNVTKQTQAISFAPLPTILRGSAPVRLQATASSGLPVAYSITSGQCLISGNLFVPLGEGSVTIRADQTGNSIYAPAASVSQSFRVIGTNWYSISGLSGSLASIAYGNDKFVVAGPTVMVSTNGLDWVPVSGSPRLSPMTYGNGVFVGRDSQSQGYYSTDGINWQPNGNADYVLGYGGGMFVTVSDTDYHSSSTSWGTRFNQHYSANGFDWQAITTTCPSSDIYSTDGYLAGVATDGNAVIILARLWSTQREVSRLYLNRLSQPDSYFWENPSVGSNVVALATIFASIRSKGTTFYGVASNSVCYSTTAGRTWLPTGASASGGLRDIYCGDARFLAVGANGAIVSSAAGTSGWRTESSGTTEPLNGAAYANGMYVVVGDNGTLLVSYYGPAVPQAPVVTSGGSASGQMGSNFSYQILTSGSVSLYDTVGLPSGLSVNPATGLISGTPSRPGTFSVTLIAANAGGASSNSLTVSISSTLPPVPVITSALTATGTVGTSFSYQICANNSPSFYGTAGLPAGLAFNPTSGQITGTPLLSGNFSVILASGNVSGIATSVLTLAIASGLPPVPAITSPTNATAVAGTPFSYQIAGNPSPSLYGAVGLPPGLSVNPTTGLVSGTPTFAGNYQVTLAAANASGAGSAALNLAVAWVPAPVITSGVTASGVSGAPFSYQITAANNPTRFAAAGLPGGLGVNEATGLISGTPTNGGTFAITVSAANAGGTATRLVTLAIPELLPSIPAISSPLTVTGRVSAPFSYQVVASGSPTNFAAGGLPSGLTINPQTGLISGTPSAGTNCAVILSAANAAGAGSAILQLTIASQAVAAPRLVAASMLPDQRFNFTLLSDAGGEVEIQASTDLAHRSTLATVTNQSGSLPIFDSGGSAGRFYRARLLR